MPAILLGRATRTTVTTISAVAIVVYILIPVAFLCLVIATIWLVIRNKKRRKARALAQAEGSNVHLYSNGYQNTQNTGYYPQGQQFGGVSNNNNGGGWVVNGAPGNNTGNGWVPNAGSSGPAAAAPAYRAMPPPGEDTEQGTSHVGDANGSKPVGQAGDGLAPPQASYNQQAPSAANSTANLIGNAQPLATR